MTRATVCRAGVWEGVLAGRAETAEGLQLKGGSAVIWMAL